MTKTQMASRLLTMAHQPEFMNEYHDFLEEASYALQNYDRDLSESKWDWVIFKDKYLNYGSWLHFMAGLIVGVIV